MCFQILRRISGGSLGNRVKASSVSMTRLVVASTLAEVGVWGSSVNRSQQAAIYTKKIHEPCEEAGSARVSDAEKRSIL